MNYRFLGFLMAVLTAGSTVVVSLAPTANAQSAGATSRISLRTPWGDPDLQGQWTNTTTTRLERPEEFKGKQVFTADELAQQNRVVAQRISLDNAPRAGDP